jgi:hypothetical protein
MVDNVDGPHTHSLPSDSPKKPTRRLSTSEEKTNTASGEALIGGSRDDSCINNMVSDLSVSKKDTAPQKLTLKTAAKTIIAAQGLLPKPAQKTSSKDDQTPPPSAKLRRRNSILMEAPKPEDPGPSVRRYEDNIRSKLKKMGKPYSKESIRALLQNSPEDLPPRLPEENDKKYRVRCDKECEKILKGYGGWKNAMMKLQGNTATTIRLNLFRFEQVQTILKSSHNGVAQKYEELKDSLTDISAGQTEKHNNAILNEVEKHLHSEEERDTLKAIRNILKNNDQPEQSIGALQKHLHYKIDQLKKVSLCATGSVGPGNLTSDYDWSALAPPESRYLEHLFVIEFNSQFRESFKQESGLLFDTNGYTSPLPLLGDKLLTKENDSGAIETAKSVSPNDLEKKQSRLFLKAYSKETKKGENNLQQEFAFARLFQFLPEEDIDLFIAVADKLSEEGTTSTSELISKSLRNAKARMKKFHHTVDVNILRAVIADKPPGIPPQEIEKMEALLKERTSNSENIAAKASILKEKIPDIELRVCNDIHERIKNDLAKTISERVSLRKIFSTKIQEKASLKKKISPKKTSKAMKELDVSIAKTKDLLDKNLLKLQERNATSLFYANEAHPTKGAIDHVLKGLQGMGDASLSILALFSSSLDSGGFYLENIEGTGSEDAVERNKKLMQASQYGFRITDAITKLHNKLKGSKSSSPEEKQKKEDSLASIENHFKKYGMNDLAGKLSPNKGFYSEMYDLRKKNVHSDTLVTFMKRSFPQTDFSSTDMETLLQQCNKKHRRKTALASLHPDLPKIQAKRENPPNLILWLNFSSEERDTLREKVASFKPPHKGDLCPNVLQALKAKGIKNNDDLLSSYKWLKGSTYPTEKKRRTKAKPKKLSREEIQEALTAPPDDTLIDQTIQRLLSSTPDFTAKLTGEQKDALEKMKSRHQKSIDKLKVILPKKGTQLIPESQKILQDKRSSNDKELDGLLTTFIEKKPSLREHIEKREGDIDVQTIKNILAGEDLDEGNMRTLRQTVSEKYNIHSLEKAKDTMFFLLSMTTRLYNSLPFEMTRKE